MQAMLLLSLMCLSAIVTAARMPLKGIHEVLCHEKDSTKYTAIAAATIYAKSVQSRFDAPRVRCLVSCSSFKSVKQALLQSIESGGDMTGVASFEAAGRPITASDSAPLPSPCLVRNHLPTIDTIKAYRNETIKAELRSARAQPYINWKGEAISWTDALKYVFMAATNAARFTFSQNSYLQAFTSVAGEFCESVSMQMFAVNVGSRDKSFRQQSFALCKKDTTIVTSYNDHAATPGFLDSPKSLARFTRDNGTILAYDVPAKNKLYVVYFEGINMDAFKSISDIPPSVRDFKLGDHPAFFAALFREAVRQ